MSNTYTITVPNSLAEAVVKYCEVTNTTRHLAILHRINYGTERSPSITVFVLYSGSREVIQDAKKDLEGILYEFNNKSPMFKLTTWQKIHLWLLK